MGVKFIRPRWSRTILAISNATLVRPHLHKTKGAVSGRLCAKNTAMDSVRRTGSGITWDPLTVEGTTGNRQIFAEEAQLVADRETPSTALDTDRQGACAQQSLSKQSETRNTGAFVSLETNESKEEESLIALSHGTADLLHRIHYESERHWARIQLIEKLRNLQGRSDCTQSQSTPHSILAGQAIVKVIKPLRSQQTRINCTTSMQHSTDKGEARLEVIKKLRYLKARSEGIESTHHPVPAGSEGGKVLVQSSERIETSSVVSADSPISPSNAVGLEFSTSYYRAAARIERDRANKFLVELAKAKAEVLRLSKPEEAIDKCYQRGQRQGERLAVSWTTRFWNKNRPQEGDLLHSLDAQTSIAGKSVEDWNCATPSSSNCNTKQTNQYSDPLLHPPSGSRKNDSNIEETRQVLEELMQIMNSLAICRDLSVQLDLRPGVHGWSVHSIFVDQVANSSDYGEI